MQLYCGENKACLTTVGKRLHRIHLQAARIFNLKYLKKFFEEIATGNRNYGKLRLSTIGISANKLYISAKF